MNISLSNKNISSKHNQPLSSILISSNIITTPCEKVLSILKEAKNFIFNISKEQNKLIQKLDWVIKIITSRSLYSYEIKEKETINKLSRENPEFKQLVDFVSEYNEKVIKMNRQYDYILTDKNLQKPSTKLNRKKIERKASFGGNNSNFLNLLRLEEINEQQNKNEKMIENNSRNISGLNNKKTYNTINSNISTSRNISTSANSNKNKNDYFSFIKCNNKPFETNSISNKKNNNKKLKKRMININDINDDEIKENKSQVKLNSYFNNNINYTSQKNSNKGNIGEDPLKKKIINKSNRYTSFPSVQTISININHNDNISINNNMNDIEDLDSLNLKRKKINTSINATNLSLTNSNIFKNNINKRKFPTNKNILHLTKDYSFLKIQNQLVHEGYDASKIINDRNFDIFLLKNIVGYNNVLPFAGRLILENLGLIDEEILNVEKLDEFLISVSNQYKPDVLYHNCLHGTDVTQSIYIFFSHSNAEKIAKTNVLDLLSIFISALGHDIGHPGLTNTYHINDSTDMAITYNDISVLENFHASTLFKTIRKTETNIFDKLTIIDYKIIRKRMISEILATDMANHGKVVSLIKSKISINENGKDYKLNLLTGNEQTKNDEQQCLLDFMIHIADLAHNTRLFDISLKWVELLSEEFWSQGDLEKQKNLPISFLCDREKINIPQSQKGFISGFIIPTFDVLSKIFPTLKFTLENANHNLKEWQKLLNEGRIRGWTPPKTLEDESNIKKSLTKKFTLKPNFLKDIYNNENKKVKFNNNINNNQIKNVSKNNTINIRKNSKKKVEPNKNNIKNRGDSKKSKNSQKKVKLNTPIKLRINDDFSLSNEKKNNFFSPLSNRKKDNSCTEYKSKKIINKKNVNKQKDGK